MTHNKANKSIILRHNSSLLSNVPRMLVIIIKIARYE